MRAGVKSGGALRRRSGQTNSGAPTFVRRNDIAHRDLLILLKLGAQIKVLLRRIGFAEQLGELLALRLRASTRQIVLARFLTARRFLCRTRCARIGAVHHLLLQRLEIRNARILLQLCVGDDDDVRRERTTRNHDQKNTGNTQLLRSSGFLFCWRIFF